MSSRPGRSAAFLFLLALVVALGAIAAVAPAASAQPAAPAAPAPLGQPGQPLRVQPSNGPPGVGRAGVTVAEPPAINTDPHGDHVESSGTGMAFLFWAFALASVGGGLFVITRRNLIAAVMGMVGSFLGIAAVYMMLYAQFLAVIQMLVYAGAIMVLFVFVIMILNRPEDEPVAPTGHVGQAIGGISILYLIARLVMLLGNVHPPGDPAKIEAAETAHTKAETALANIRAGREKSIQEAQDALDKAGSGSSTMSTMPTPEQVAKQYDAAIETANKRIEQTEHGIDAVTAKVAPGKVQLPGGETADWGTVRAVGSDLFQGGLFPFEAISILLLIAVVGAIAVAKPLKDDDDEDGDASLGEDLAAAAAGAPKTEGGHA